MGKAPIAGSVDVLILDAETRPALAVVRSLGAQGFRLGVVASSRCALASGSRFAGQSFLLPDPRADSASYVTALMELLSAVRPRILLPISDLTTGLVLEHRAKLPPEIILPGVDHSTFQSVAAKSLLLGRAKALGLNVPMGITLSADDPDIERTIAAFSSPGVLKPETREQQIEGAFRKPAVSYVSHPAEVMQVLRRAENTGLKFLLQQRIEGPGVGVFALCLRGKALATFCHRRILEKPPSGGRSVLSESIPESEAPVEDALRLLRDLAWEGVAMVEFKTGSDGRHYLMEINPRFWGSLQLAIDSGRDFPSLLIRLFGGETSPEQRFEELQQALQPYQTGRRLRWDLGCLDHVLIRCKAAPAQAFRDLFFGNSLQLFSRPFATGHETFRLTDPLPFVYELWSYGRDVFR